MGLCAFPLRTLGDVNGRWGWIAGPPAEEPVYAPALVVFIGGGGSFGGNVGWFPLGPREVYVPSYLVSREYVNRVNVSNTTVNTTTITNVYNTTIINKTTNVTNVTYVNRNVQGAVTAVPQRAFASAQPVGRHAAAERPADRGCASQRQGGGRSHATGRAGFEGCNCESCVGTDRSGDESTSDR